MNQPFRQMTSSPTLSKPISQDEGRPAYGAASEKKKTSKPELKDTPNTLKDEQRLIKSIEEEDKKIKALKLEVEQFKLIIKSCGSDPATLYAALCSGPSV